MADLVKVKARKQHQWDQDSKYLYIKINMPGHTTIKNLQIFLSDLILRITSKQKKSVETLDLLNEVDYLSADNKFVLSDGIVSATLKKKQQGLQWQTLLIDGISIGELKERRKASEGRYEQNSKQILQTKQKLKTEYDRLATKQLMRFEEEERKKLDQRKQNEKNAALNEVFRNVNEKTGRIEYEETKWNEKGAKDLEILEKQQEQQRKKAKQERDKAKQKKLIQQIQTQSKSTQPQTNNSIFTEEDITKEQELRETVEQQALQIPIRKQAKVNLKFTQKLYPLVATRDYHYTEPPMPKLSTPLPPPRQGDLQNRNPLWLKDRGDGFMNIKNYSAALEAYTQAIKIDSSQKKIFMNRSLANMKLFNLDAAINDCDVVLLQMQKQIVGNQDQQNKHESLLDLVKIKTRKGICLAWKGKLKESKQILSEQLSFPLDQGTKSQIQSCLQALENREKSIHSKSKGDEAVKRQSYEEAIALYEGAVEIDQNQYALSNKCLCLNKVQNYEQSIKTADQGVQVIEEFLGSANSKNHPDQSVILMKLLYRKSTALEGLKRFKQAEQTLNKASTLNPEDRDIKQALKNIKSKQSSEEVIKLKEQASKQLQNNRPKQALDLYIAALKLLQDEDNISEYLKILQNQCVCYLKLQQYDSIIVTTTRIITLANKMDSKIIQFGDKKTKSMDKKQLNLVKVRAFTRRANAYSLTGQVYNAKSDLQKAVELDPSNATLAGLLEEIKTKLG